MKDSNTAGGLNKYLSGIDVWALSLGCIIGWGAFVMPGTTFLPVAGPGGTVIAIAVSTLVTLIIGYNYFTLMKRYPGTGGVYAYSKAVFGRDHAFLGSWFLCLAYVSLIPQNATILSLIIRLISGNAFRGSVYYQVAGTHVYLTDILISVFMLVLIGFFAICMKPFLQAVQTLLGVILVAGVIVIAILLLPRVHPEDLFSSFGIRQATPFQGILSIAILAPWAFVGFEVVSLETAHFRFPIRKSGKLLGLAVLVGGCIYVVLALTAIVRQPEGYVNWQAYISALDGLEGIAAVPVFYVLSEVVGPAGFVIISITALAAVISSIIGFYRASARILMNMAQDHILADSFNKPSVCFLFLMGLSAIICLFGRTALSWIVDLSSLGAIVGFAYVSAAVYRQAKKEHQSRQQVIGLTGLILAAAFAAAQLIPGISFIETMNAMSYLLLAIWCLFGFVFYWRTLRSDDGMVRRNESLTISALLVLLIFSIVIWYVKEMVPKEGSSVTRSQAVWYSVVLLVFILLGLSVMLLVHTQLKKKQMRAETEKIRAVESSQAKSRFLFNMSHDIRTPMNAIIGYTGLALKEPMSAEVRTYLEKIDLSSHHLLALINDILEMSRIESGKVELNEEPMDPAALLEEIRQLYDEQMKQKKICFDVNVQLADCYVYCDRKSLARVLFNLVGNAYKFTPEGGSVRLSAREDGKRKADIRQIEICVKDSGIGMSEEFAEKMFTAFERERTSTDSGVEGTGLGLAISKSIIDLMGGTIDVTTAPGCGTEITVRLPLKPAPAPEKEQKTDGIRKEETVSHDRAKRILLAEDNAINMEIANMILQQAGFLVENAENGKLAVDKLKEKEAGYYDAVLMDIQMPVMDGYTATRTIRAMEDPAKNRIPVIAMTANAFKEDEEAAYRAGMQGHIAKPINVDIMLETLNRILQ